MAVKVVRGTLQLHFGHSQVTDGSGEDRLRLPRSGKWARLKSRRRSGSRCRRRRRGGGLRLGVVHEQGQNHRSPGCDKHI
jgi:hypothetical protein